MGLARHFMIDLKKPWNVVCILLKNVPVKTRQDVQDVPFLIAVATIMNFCTNTLHLKFYKELMMESKLFYKSQGKEIDRLFNLSKKIYSFQILIIFSIE